jgi:azurin
MKNIASIILLIVGINSLVLAQSKPANEEDFYALKTISIPANIALEVGGIATLPDGSIAVSTRHGEIWLISNPYSKDSYYKKFASGMHEVLGLAYHNGSFYCTQRGELTKITDENNDGVADKYEAVYRFDLSGNYHEYAYGPVFDKEGNLFVTLNVAWIGYGEGLAKWHGWMVKIKPDGSIEPWATGLRSPAGFMQNSAGDWFYGENQGDWVGSGRVTHLAKGDFAGNAGGLTSTSDVLSPIKLTKLDLKAVDNDQPMHEAAKKIPSMKLPAVWFPHTLMGISTADIQEDTTKGAFGPFVGQYFVADQGHSKVMRMTLEKVNGQYQGACYPFREGWASGILRLRWGNDGSLIGGMTSRGWSSTGKADFALQRLIWTGKTPFEMKDIKAMPDGLEIEFTMPVDKKSARNVKNYDLNSFTYQYHHQYGSPITNKAATPLKGIFVSEDGLKVRLVIDNLREGYIQEVKLGDILTTSGTPLLHNVAYYTMNAIPAGSKADLAANQLIKEVEMKHEHTTMPASTMTKVSSKRITSMPVDWTAPDQVLTLGTKPGLKYDRAELKVKAGAKIQLNFNNNDDMQHNMVITMPNAANEIGAAALDLGLSGSDLSYVPESAKVLFHTFLLEPGTSETIYFIAPEKAGTYQYVCTYPGHYSIMQGVLKVVN